MTSTCHTYRGSGCDARHTTCLIGAGSPACAGSCHSCRRGREAGAARRSQQMSAEAQVRGSRGRRLTPPEASTLVICNDRFRRFKPSAARRSIARDERCAPGRADAFEAFFRNGRSWRNRPLQPRTAFSRLPTLKVAFGSDLTRSLSRRPMAGLCAFRPKTGVDVKGHCGSRRWTSWGKLPLGAADSLSNERPALIFRSLGGFRWIDGGF
jgi:hypothetical protein